MRVLALVICFMWCSVWSYSVGKLDGQAKGFDTCIDTVSAILSRKAMLGTGRVTMLVLKKPELVDTFVISKESVL